MRRWWIAGCILLVADLLVVYSILTFSRDEQVLLRNLLYSQIYSDRELPTAAAVDERLRKSFRRDSDPSAYLKYLNSEKASELLAMSRTAGITDREMARAITEKMGGLSDGRVCGIESLGRIVFDTEKGIGCCSDFSKAWLFYATYVGMTVREVNSINHTTVEYLDRKTGNWNWIDPFNRIEILEDRRPISQHRIRESNLFQALEFSRMHAGNPKFDAARFEGYSPSQLSVLMWRLGTNFLEVDRWDRVLQRIGFAKSARQAVLLTVGIQPHWLILTTESLAIQLRALQKLLYFFFIAFAFTNVGFLFVFKRKHAAYGASAAAAEAEAATSEEGTPPLSFGTTEAR